MQYCILGLPKPANPRSSFQHLDAVEPRLPSNGQDPHRMGGDILLDGRGQAGFGAPSKPFEDLGVLHSRWKSHGGGDGPLLQVDTRSAKREGALKILVPNTPPCSVSGLLRVSASL